MSVPDDDARAASEFEEMVRTAARDSRVTGLRFSLQQARSGAYALLGAALLFVATGLFSIFAMILQTAETLRLVAVILYLFAAGVFLILFFWARRDPWLPSLIGLVVYCVLIVPSVIILFFDFWLIGLLVLIGLIDAVRAAFQHRRILRKALLNEVGPEPTGPVN